ncbi:DUF1330 domain-containing protein [Candidatus Poriferisodalis sp.]|uniref:DUF1330 domain-containing protein n=1 Tax=Candidatus Poriferisodalis sp. TaxID=3101277 RepID=UPI003AF53D10
MHKHASTAQIDAVAEGDPDEPVVMLNLLRYRETAESGYGVDGMSGEDAYREYGRRFAELHPRFGGEPIWMGHAGHTAIGPNSEQWDIAILVRYPTRVQFVAMFRDPDYLAIAPIRAAALEDSRIIETTQLLPRV